jgi:hypothetical protein
MDETDFVLKRRNPARSRSLRMVSIDMQRLSFVRRQQTIEVEEL